MLTTVLDVLGSLRFALLLVVLITVACMAVPQLNGCFERTEIAGHEYLVVSLDGEMIPWEEVPLDELKKFEAEEGEADEVIAKLKQLTLVIAIGIRDEYLMFSIGQSTDCLAGLGEGELLIDRAELKPLKKFADERLTGISYVSGDMNAINLKNIENLLELVDEVLPHSGLPADEQDQIRRDAAVLVKDFKRLAPKPGPVLAFSFLTGQGVEGYSYNFGENSWFDGSKPLGLLENTGGDPLLAAVWREKYSPANYDIVAKWCAIGYRYFDKYAVPEMPPRERKKFRQFVELISPLPERLDRANRQMLIPALADCQGGIVLDAELKIRKLVRNMPDPGKPMPILEPAMVMSVSDAELLRKACGEYRAVFEAVIEALREVEPDEIPEFELPKAKIKKTDVGTIYSYPLPKQWKVDRKIVPSIGLSDSVAVFTITQDHAERLLTATSLSTGGLLSDPGQPAAAAFLLDFAGLVDAATPWVELVAQKIIADQMDVSDDASEADKAKADSIMAEVHTVLEVLKTLRTVTAKSQFDGGVLITHSLTEIRDVR